MGHYFLDTQYKSVEWISGHLLNWWISMSIICSLELVFFLFNPLLLLLLKFTFDPSTYCGYIDPPRSCWVPEWTVCLFLLQSVCLPFQYCYLSCYLCLSFTLKLKLLSRVGFLYFVVQFVQMSLSLAEDCSLSFLKFCLSFMCLFVPTFFLSQNFSICILEGNSARPRKQNSIYEKQKFKTKGYKKVLSVDHSVLVNVSPGHGTCIRW